LSIYAFAVFGYVTASLASLFVESDARAEGTEMPGASQIEEVRGEIAALRRELRVLGEHLRSGPEERAG
jgi:voltage-gated potassium channel